MKVEFFDVGHGACALLTAGNRRIMIDCASSTEFDFFPGEMLRGRGVNVLDLLIITNFDEDHARGLPNLREHVKISRLRVNRNVPPEKIDELKGYEPGPGIAAAIELAKTYSDFSTTMEPIPNVSWWSYSHAYETSGFTDENNLSLVLFLKVGGVTFLFPGDMECEGMEALLDKHPKLCTDLANVTVYVAPHHGRESGKCARVFDQYGCKPKLVVISDKGYVHDTQQTVPWYRAKVQAGDGGWVLTGETDASYVLSTRDRGTITFAIEPNPSDGWFMDVSGE